MSSDFAAAEADAVCLTVDVEWAHPEVLADLTQAFDERGLNATLFCTHEGVVAGNHERALHPNFRRQGDTMKRLRESHPEAESWNEPEIYDFVVNRTKQFAPEAVGVRAHSLFYDSDLFPIYRAHGLRYDSSVCLPFMPHLAPVQKECGLVEFPIYYMDHLDIIEGMTDFRLESLRLDAPGLKVFDFHPNIVFINASTNDAYLDSKRCYHDVTRLKQLRRSGRGIRTLFLELLDFLADRRRTTLRLGVLCETLRVTGIDDTASPLTWSRR